MPSGCLRVPARACTRGDCRRWAGWLLGIILRLVRTFSVVGSWDLGSEAEMEHRRQQGRGPLAAHAEGFAAEMSRRGYSPSAVHLRLWLLHSLSRWLEEQDLAPSELTSQHVERFVADRRARGLKSWVSLRSLALPMEYLCSVGVVAPPAEPLRDGPVEGVLAGYRRYLVMERGLAATTIADYEVVARLFLTRRVAAAGLDLFGLSGGDVLAFARAECSRRRTPSAQHAMAALRSLLRYLHVAGLTGSPLAAAVPAIAGRHGGLPKGLSAGEAARLLASCDRRRPVGLRDYAILLLLVRLGLRAGEVAAMRVADVDWRAGEILVRGKGDRQDRLPLPVDVGDALVNYVQRGRAGDAGPSMFARVIAPRGPLRPTGVEAVVHDACVRCGMVPVGAHRLRHTAATGMLRAGGSLPEIAQVLRHRRLETTAIYAKVDRAAVRPLAPPWPGSAR